MAADNNLMHTTCPNGHPSGPFPDPRFEPGTYLGTYSCATCKGSWPLIDILRAQDERDMEALLNG